MSQRGFAYIIKDLGGGKHSWESAPPWCYNGSQYVPYIFFRDDSKKCYDVQTGLVGARVFDTGVAEFFDPSLKEVRVKSEEWQIWSAGKQATLNSPITWEVIEDKLGIHISRKQTTSKPNGSLIIIYHFYIGYGLKHEVQWTSSEALPVTVEVKQIHLIDFDKVVADNVTSTSNTTKKASIYKFSYGANESWVIENQYSSVWGMGDEGPYELTNQCLKDGNIDFAGKKVTYTFGDWTLLTNGSLLIDPATLTNSDPAIFILADKAPLFPYGYTRQYNIPGMIFRDWVQDVQHGYRCYVQWDISAIPVGSDVTLVKFLYNGYRNFDPAFLGIVYAIANIFTQYPDDNTGNQNLHTDCGDGAVFYSDFAFPEVGIDKEITLNASAETDLEAHLGYTAATVKAPTRIISGVCKTPSVASTPSSVKRVGTSWWAIGLSEETGGESYKWIHSQTYVGVDPPPTLYVEYT